MATKKYDNEVQFTLRINKDVYDAVKQAAEENRRSIAKEIENCLYWNYQAKQESVSSPEIDQAMRKVIQLYQKELDKKNK